MTVQLSTTTDNSAIHRGREFVRSESGLLFALKVDTCLGGTINTKAVRDVYAYPFTTDISADLMNRALCGSIILPIPTRSGYYGAPLISDNDVLLN